MTKFQCVSRPCASCPYRKDVPSGVWAKEEYDKLRRFDTQPPGQVPATGVFLCHTDRERLCRGWLTVHSDSVAVRILLRFRQITRRTVYAPVDVPLFSSGAEAADHGVRDITHPSVEAEVMMGKVERLIEHHRGAGEKAEQRPEQPYSKEKDT